MKSDIVIGGVGMVPFRKPGQSESYDLMGEKAVNSALHDAGIPYSLVEQAFCGYVYGDSCAGQAALYRVDISGIPVFNVNNNCASGSSAFALAVQASQVEPRAFVVAASEHRPIDPRVLLTRELISQKLDEYEDAVISAVGQVRN